MFIIGERINSTRQFIARAVQVRDAAFIQAEAKMQVNAGARMLDVNCGTLAKEEEPSSLEWLVKTVQEAVDVPLCIDSPNPVALAAALSAHRGKALINSISAEGERYRHVLPLIKEYGAAVVALCMDERGLPKDGIQAMETGSKLINRLLDDGVSMEDIYFDPLIRSVGTSTGAALNALQTMSEMREKFLGLHLVSGLSNVSHGLPERRHLNRAFLVLSIEHGLDTVIIDPTDGTAMALVYATEALLDRDRFCLEYIRAFRLGRLGGK